MPFWNYFIKLKLHTFYYSDRIIVIIYVNNSKNMPRLMSVKLVLTLSASARALAPSSPILLLT